MIIAVAMGAMAVGQANSFAPDYGKAKQSAAKCFELLDREPAINSFDESGKKPVSNKLIEALSLTIEFRMIRCSLRNLNIICFT